MTTTRHERRPDPVHHFAPPASHLHRTGTQNFVSRTDTYECSGTSQAPTESGGFGAKTGRRCGESFPRGGAPSRGSGGRAMSARPLLCFGRIRHGYDYRPHPVWFQLVLSMTREKHPSHPIPSPPHTAAPKSVDLRPGLSVNSRYPFLLHLSPLSSPHATYLPCLLLTPASSLSCWI
jgi:hypothetical protein